jgi:hypothetical protein
MTATFGQTDAGPSTSAPPRGGAAWTPGSEDDRRLRVARWLLEIEDAGFAFVKVPEPIPHPSGDPKLADCHCPRTSETRARNGICASPGKHPTGEAWQRSGRRDLRVIAGILRQPGYQLGVVVLPGGRGFILDEDLRTGVDADVLMAEWAERDGAEPPATFVVRSGGGGRHLYGLRPEGYVVPASWPGGEVRWAGDGSKGGGMVVAPLGLHASGNRYEPLTGLPPAEFSASLLDHVVGRHATSGTDAAGEGTDRERDTEGFRVPLPGEAWYAAVNSWCGRLRHLDRTDGEAWARVLELAPGLSDWETRRDFGDGCADRVTHLRHRFESCWADATRDFEPAGEPIHINLGGTRGSSAEPTGPWPAPLDADAFHGLAGRFARAVIPYSEGDPPAILCQALAMFGCLVGGEVYAIAGDAPHPARLNLLTVGVTGKGRKDTAGRPAKRLAAYADPAFTSRFVQGLSSGEGVIWAVRDPIVKTVMTGKGPDRHTEEQEVDPGVADKRLFVRESEFASVLRVSQRDGNILSPVVRRAWESGDLQTLTRNNPVVATGAHVVISANITRDELLRYLDRTEIASGFMNRFLLCAAKRAQVLPDGEGVPDAVLRPFANELRAVLEWAREPRILRRNEEARRMWHVVYEPLSEGAPGLYGAATSRAEAQVLRLSVLYAILDRAEAIAAEHLLAALAVWRYCADSVRWVFGDATGDPVADAIIEALRTRGPMTRTAIGELFGRHIDRGRIERGLVTLEQLGRIKRSKVATGGRPVETWEAA